MADAYTEQIVNAIELLLDGATDAGSNVQRGQVHPHEANKLPAIAIFMGPDTPDAEYHPASLDWAFTVLIETTVSVPADYTDMSPAVETPLAELRKQIHALLLADHRLGLAFVIKVDPGPASQPILDGDGEVPVGSQVLQFDVRYRSSFADISEL